MQFLHLPRGAGKTTKTLEWLRQDKKRLMLTHDRRTCECLRREHPDLAGQIHSFWDGPIFGADFSEATMDNLDIVMGMMVEKDFGCPLTLASINKEEE